MVLCFHCPGSALSVVLHNLILTRTHLVPHTLWDQKAQSLPQHQRIQTKGTSKMGLRLPPEEYAALCKAVLMRDKYRCRSCGMRSGLCCHHIVFRSQQGEDTTKNLCTLCLACHNGIHVDVHDGVFGLTVLPNENGIVNADKPVQFLRQPWWRPI